MKIIYWFIFGVIFYAYIGYPVVLYLLSHLPYLKKKREGSASYPLPTVSLLIAAYNEEKVIRAKIENCLLLDYPKELLQIWVASDGSSDNTNRIVKEYAEAHDHVHLLEFPRTGKSGMLNQAMNWVNSEVVVFSDANTEYSADAVKRLVRHFEDPGCRLCERPIDLQKPRRNDQWKRGKYLLEVRNRTEKMGEQTRVRCRCQWCHICYQERPIRTVPPAYHQ